MLMHCVRYHLTYFFVFRFELVAKNPVEKTDNWAKELSNCILLQDAEISYNGIRIYGTPW